MPTVGTGRAACPYASGIALDVFRKTFAVGLGQERRQHDADDVDEPDSHRGVTISPEAGDQGSGEKRPGPCEQARYVEAKGDRRAADTGWIEFRKPGRHPRVLPETEEPRDRGNQQQQADIVRPQEQHWSQQEGQREIARRVHAAPGTPDVRVLRLERRG